MSSNYFDLFQLPPAFELDVTLLQSRYRELQKQCHPDRFASQSADVQRAAVQKAADINTALATLQDPVLRARHLLALAGHELGCESTTVSDTDFLMAQMELREQMQDARDMASLSALQDEVADWLRNLGREFVLDYQEQDWAEAADTVRKMQFMSRLLQELARAQAGLDDDDEAYGDDEEDF